MITSYSSSNTECVPEKTLNITSPDNVSKLLYKDAERIIITIVYPILLFIGLLGNTAFLYMMVRIHRMRTITNIYLMNLALADIGFLSMAVGEKLGRYLASPLDGDQYSIGLAGCLIIYTFTNTCYFASLYLITMVTVEKYYAICRPVKHRLIASINRSIKLAILGWIVAVCFACFIIPTYSNFETICLSWPPNGQYDYLPGIYGACAAVDEWVINYGNGLQTVPFFLALIFNVLMYIRIIQTLTRRARILPAAISSGMECKTTTTGHVMNAERIKIRNQVTVMIVITGTAFFICLAPHQGASLTRMITGALETQLLTQQQLETLLYVGRVLTYLNSAINPYIYHITNSRYRQCFREAFWCWSVYDQKCKNRDTLCSEGSSSHSLQERVGSTTDGGLDFESPN